jgi:hypothetical protein
VFFLNNVRYQSADPQLTGRDILRQGGSNPATDHVLIQVQAPGTRSVGLDERVDLTEEGRESFWAFASDRIFTFTVDERGYEWGAREISEDVLRSVTGAPEDKDFVLERGDEPDRVIGDGESVNLGERGTERIRTVRATTIIIVNAEEKRVEGRRISFEALVRLAFETPPTGPNILITIDYGDGPPANPKGSLKPGHSVKIKNRMSFDVTATDRS